MERPGKYWLSFSRKLLAQRVLGSFFSNPVCGKNEGAGDLEMHSPAPAPSNAEDLLRRWLTEHEPLEAGSLLEALMLHAEKIVRRIVSFKLCQGAYDRPGRTSMDIEDACNTALANLISRLARIKAGGDPTHIQNFEDYAASVAFNACNEYFRKRHPERYSLANQVRYLLRHRPDLRLWKMSGDLEVCGYTAWEGRELASAPDSLRDALSWPRKRLSIELLYSIFEVVGGPLEFEQLVDQVAGILGIRTQRTVSVDEGALADTEASIEEQLCARQFLEQLWAAICRLPLQQRRALLLNMKDSNGGDIGVLDWFGVATVQQIAEAIEIPAADFAEMWKELPINDKRIAQLCGLSVQDVINRRSSARKTLKKYLKDMNHGN